MFETPNGEWVYRDKDNHKCIKPQGTHEVKAGDIWQCECGIKWKVTKCERKGMTQRDEWYSISWEQYHGEIPNQKTASRFPYL